MMVIRGLWSLLCKRRFDEVKAMGDGKAMGNGLSSLLMASLSRFSFALDCASSMLNVRFWRRKRDDISRAALRHTFTSWIRCSRYVPSTSTHKIPSPQRRPHEKNNCLTLVTISREEFRLKLLKNLQNLLRTGAKRRESESLVVCLLENWHRYVQKRSRIR